MGLIDRLDRIVIAAGFYPPAPPRPRHMRWLPLAALALGAAGFALHVADLWLGSVLTPLAFAMTALFVVFGPLRNPTPDEPLDERETLLRIRASRAGFATVAGIALAGSVLFSLAGFLPVWTPRTSEDWTAIAFTLMTIFWCVMHLHASWTTRPLDPERD